MVFKWSILLSTFALVARCSAQVYTASVEPSLTLEGTIEPLQQQQQTNNNDNDFITQTVYGFLDFTTTLANTVMVFSPQSAPPEGNREAKSSPISSTIETKPKELTNNNNKNIKPSSISNSNKNSGDTKKGKIIVNSIIEQNVVSHVDDSSEDVKTLLATLRDDVPGLKNNLAEPEYDFLSRQPTEIIDETYKVINLKPSADKYNNKPAPTQQQIRDKPTGWVKKLGGTIVKDGLTTVHETNVIGTYINGKYAQVLQSSSKVLKSNQDHSDKIKPSGSQRILKTIGPQNSKLKHLQEQAAAASNNNNNDEQNNDTVLGPGGRPIRRGSSNQIRPKYRTNKVVEEAESNTESVRVTAKNRSSTSRPSYKNRSTTPAPVTESSTRKRPGFRPTSSSSTTSVKQYKNSKTESTPLISNPLAKSKLPRTQGRWSYKTTPRPRVQIRKQNDDEPKQQVQQLPPSFSQEQSISGVQQNSEEQQQQAQRKEIIVDGELDESESEDNLNISIQQDLQNNETPSIPKPLPMETLNVEISTAADLNDIYFEIATIKSPYEFQVGTARNTRYVTVTSTIKKSFATVDPATSISPTEPLTENILANTGAAYESSLPLDSSIATLPPITLEPSQETPPLETITETFSTTQTLLKTHLLPVITNDNSTTRLTLVQTYNIARIVTATKTLPPSEIYQFIPSKTLNEFNTKLDEAGSELHLELDFGDDENDDDDIPKRVIAPSSDLDADLNGFKSISPTNRLKNEQKSSSIVTEPALTPEQAQQLALLKLFGQGQPQVITTSRPVVVIETLFESHVIPIINNGNTFMSTLSRPIGTVPKTSYEYGTSTIAPILPVPPSIPQVPLFPPVQPQFTVTSAPIVQQTIATVSDSKVLKLTFGAKTAYTTLYSTRVVPTELTTYVTSTIALQPSVAAFPGYFPPPVGYPGYPYVG